MVGTILLIAITVALAAVVATLVGGLGGRGAPPNALLTVTARENTDDTTIVNLTISHEGGDDLALSDLTVKVIDDDGNEDENSSLTRTFSVGNTVFVTVQVTGATFDEDDVITVYIIHDPSKQKIFSSSTVVVQEAE